MAMESQAAVTMAKTNSAIQLYRALERANLLQYFDQFIAQGGDDLQQLCEAEEGEFFEIMELVGMSSKPLHVRRLQKVLQEYMADPKTFETQTTVTSKQTVPTDYSITSQENSSAANKTFASLAGLNQYSRQSFSPKFGTPGTSPVTPATSGENANLSEEHITNVRIAAMAIVQEMDMQSLPLPRKIPPEMRPILEMAPEHPQREEEIRKWAPIYGRFDSKRKSEKPLSLHEVTVNEAACQLCLLEPNLLFMRDRLFPLARQVVRESGYQYKHGQSSRSNRDMRIENIAETPPSVKRPRLGGRDSDNTRTVQAELMKLRREERMNEIANQLTLIKEQQANLKDKIALAKVDQNLQKIYDLQIELEKLTSQQLTLMTEQTDLIKRQRRSDRYYGSKSSRYTWEDNSKSGGDSNRSSPHPAEDQLAENEMDKEISDTGEVKSVRNGSPKPDGTRSSRRKGTPRSHQAFMKQTLMDEGLRLAQGFNNGVDEYANPALQNYRLEDDHELRRAYGLKETIPVGSIETEDFNTLTETTSVVSAGHIKREDFIKSEPLDDAALGLSGTDVSQVDGQENGHVEDEQQTEMAEDHTDTVQTDKSLNDSGMLQEADTQGQRTVKMEQVDMGQSLETSQGLEEEQDLTASQQYVLVSQQQDMAFPQDMLVQ